ncbi:MAG: PIN domain-containing protein [Deltaproteobacteria bacterium]|nr:PIN domain-containing protein [Deltaproteobacteria bacterium]
MILVDSSVWIAAWRGSDAETVAQLTQLIERETVAINWLIRTELLQGARDRTHARTVQRLLEPIPVIPFPDALWDAAPGFYLECRQAGVTLTTIDSLIATHVKVARYQLWSLDHIFTKIPHFSSHAYDGCSNSHRNAAMLTRRSR